MDLIKKAKRKKFTFRSILVFLSLVLATGVGVGIYYGIINKKEDKQEWVLVSNSNNYKIKSQRGVTNSLTFDFEDSDFNDFYLNSLSVAFDVIYPNKGKQTEIKTFNMNKNKGCLGELGYTLNSFNSVRIKNYNKDFFVRIKAWANGCNIDQNDYEYSTNDFSYEFYVTDLPADYSIENVFIYSKNGQLVDKLDKWVDITNRVLVLKDKASETEDDEWISATAPIDVTPKNFTINKYDELKLHELEFLVEDSRFSLKDVDSDLSKSVARTTFKLRTDSFIQTNSESQTIKYWTTKDIIEDKNIIYGFVPYEAFKTKPIIDLGNSYSRISLTQNENNYKVIGFNDYEDLGYASPFWEIRLRLTFDDSTISDTEKNFFASGIKIKKIEYMRVDVRWSYSIDAIYLNKFVALQ